MARRDNTYSRVVAWLKIALPLAALALLSTLFLFSQETRPTDDLPFSDVDLLDRVRDQQITAPYFAGTTQDGSTMTITAQSARPATGDSDRATAEGINGRIRLVRGGMVRLQSDAAEMDEAGGVAELSGNVVITSSTGYRITTDQLISALDRVDARSGGEVQGNGPPGRFTAGRLHLASDPDTGDALLLFTDGVKLIYDPQGQE